MSHVPDLLRAARDCRDRGLPVASVISLTRTIRALPMIDGFRAVRLSILASSNADFLAPALEVVSFADRIRLSTSTAGFNQVDQQLLDSASVLFEFSPQLVLIYVRAEDIIPKLSENLESVSDDLLHSWIDQIGQKYEVWCSKLASAGIQTMLTSFARPARSPLGIRDMSHPKGQYRTWLRLNEKLLGVASARPGVTVVDFDGLVRRIGLNHWEDAKLWSLAKIAGGTKFAASFADEIMPVVRELAGRRRKCLVLDLDNTLWGGVIGEDGIEGVRLGGDYPGDVFREVQKIAEGMWEQGVLLAINSKNNIAEVEAMIQSHPEMILRLEHFAVRQINWNDKVENLRTIASELNVGLESLLFVDDNPVECDRVRGALAEVDVLQVPTDLAAYPRKFREFCRALDGIAVSSEDRMRNQMYEENRMRQSDLDAIANVDEFLGSLGMSAEVERLNSANVSRVVQLLHKTNQFNVTTRRHTAQAVVSLMDSDEWLSYVVRLKDKFGDNGIVLVALVQVEGIDARIDTFLMSCRVIGRTLEQAVLALIAREMRGRGMRSLIGEYIRTAKNELVNNLFPSLGFATVESRADLVRYELLLVDDGLLKGSEHIALNWRVDEQRT